jgi:hypothetical protein
MNEEPKTPLDLEPECRRAGVDFYEGLRSLVNWNLPPDMPRVERGESVNASIDLALFDRVLRSLPDGAGTQRFVEAIIKEFETRYPGRGRARPGGAGA